MNGIHENQGADRVSQTEGLGISLMVPSAFDAPPIATRRVRELRAPRTPSSQLAALGLGGTTFTATPRSAASRVQGAWFA
jgi:hypothetical protein